MLLVIKDLRYGINCINVLVYILMIGCRVLYVSVVLFFQVEEKYVANPSSFLKIPGNKIRLQGIRQYCLDENQKQRDRESRGKLKSIMNSSQRSNQRSRSPNENRNQNTEKHPTEEQLKVKLLKTIKDQVQKINIKPQQRVGLENPIVDLKKTSDKLSASIICLVCDASAKAKPCTAYVKGNSWQVSNFKRHLERYHLKPVSPVKGTGSLKSFFHTKTTEVPQKGASEDVTVELDPCSIVLSDEEEDRLRNSAEQNFSTKE